MFIFFIPFKYDCVRYNVETTKSSQKYDTINNNINQHIYRELISVSSHLIFKYLFGLFVSMINLILADYICIHASKIVTCYILKKIYISLKV